MTWADPHSPNLQNRRVKVATTAPTKYSEPQKGALRKHVPKKSEPHRFQITNFIRGFRGEQTTLMPPLTCSEDSGSAAYFLKQSRSRKLLKCFIKPNFLEVGGFCGAPFGFSGSP